MNVPLGLTLAFVSAVAVNLAYAREHDAAAAMPHFSATHPVKFVSTLFGDRSWVAGFATETGGWLVYVAALRLAPLSLVQAVCASGIAVLAVVRARGHPRRLSVRERAAVTTAVAGLVLLSLSLTGTHQADHAPSWPPVVVWLGASAAGALALATVVRTLARAPALGLAAGLLFAGGDISAKLVVYGGGWFAAVVSLVVLYALGTSLLQGAFQHGDALTGAGLATLATNAVPIAAGFVVFGEELPHGLRGGFQVAAFTCIVAGAVFLSHVPHDRAEVLMPTVSPSPTFSAMDQNLITPAGMTRLSEELEHLKTVARAELSSRMHDAYTSETDPTENTEYQEIQAEQALLEARIARLERRLAEAEIAEPNPRNGIADLGERVRVRDVDTDEEAEYELVGTTEADPGAGRISVESPVGRALLGCRRGDVAVADTPQRKRRLEVLSIRQPRRPRA